MDAVITRSPRDTDQSLQTPCRDVLSCTSPHMYDWIKRDTSAVPPCGIEIESHCFLPELKWEICLDPHSPSSAFRRRREIRGEGKVGGRGLEAPMLQ